jgi:hypothetical protein
VLTYYFGERLVIACDFTLPLEAPCFMFNVPFVKEVFFTEDLCKNIHIIHCYLYFRLFLIVVIKISLGNFHGYILVTIITIKFISN